VDDQEKRLCTSLIPFGVASGESLYVSAQQYAGPASATGCFRDEYARMSGPGGEFGTSRAPAERRVRRHDSAAAVGRRPRNRLELAATTRSRKPPSMRFRKLRSVRCGALCQAGLASCGGHSDYHPAPAATRRSSMGSLRRKWIRSGADDFFGLIAASRFASHGRVAN